MHKTRQVKITAPNPKVINLPAKKSTMSVSSISHMFRCDMTLSHSQEPVKACHMEIPWKEVTYQQYRQPVAKKMQALKIREENPMPSLYFIIRCVYVCIYISILLLVI